MNRDLRRRGLHPSSASERPIDRARSRPVLRIRTNISPIRAPDGTSATANGSSRIRKPDRSATTGMETAGKKCTRKSLRTKSERQDGIRPVAPIDPDRCDRRRTENRVARQLIRPNATKKGQGQTVRRCCIKIGNTGQENKFFGRNFHP